MSLSKIRNEERKKLDLPETLQNTSKSNAHQTANSTQIIQAVPMLQQKLFSCIVLHSIESVKHRWETVVGGEHGPVHEAVEAETEKDIGVNNDRDNKRNKNQNSLCKKQNK